MEEVTLNISRMKIYVNNILSIYLVLEKLQNQLIKRFEKGKEVDFKHLEKCSTMYLLARLSAKAVQEYDGDIPSREEKAAFRFWLTDKLISDCKWVANM